MPALAFNSNGIDPRYSGGGEQLPVGRHPVVIVASSVKPNQANTGGYVEFTLQAIDGPAKGQSQTDRLNIYHNKPDVAEIAQRQLAAYCAVTNTPAFQATEELHNKPFMIEVGPQKAPNERFHEVKALFDANGNEPGKAGAGPQTSNNGGYQQQQGGQNFGATGSGSIPNQQQQGGGYQQQQGGGQQFGGQQGQQGQFSPDQAQQFGQQGGGFQQQGQQGGGQGQGGQNWGQQQQGAGQGQGQQQGGNWQQGAGQQGGGAGGPSWGQRS